MDVISLLKMANINDFYPLKNLPKINEKNIHLLVSDSFYYSVEDSFYCKIKDIEKIRVKNREELFKIIYNYGFESISSILNITDEMIIKYNIGFCYQGEFQNRIIIPSYDEDDEINYFIARSILSKPKMKYKNPEAQKEIIIWNEHLIDWDKPVYLVEGVFDSIFLPNSIPMLGKVLHERLYKLIYEKAKKIIILLDPDAWSNTVKLFHKINAGKLLGKVWVIKLEGEKDVADLSGDISEYEEFQIN